MTVALVGCTDTYECPLSIGDSTVENDSVSVYYVIESEFGNGYSIKGHFRAESQADLDRDFMFTITFDDYLSSGSYSESTLVSCKGIDIKDGKKFNFEIKLDNVAKYFSKTKRLSNATLCCMMTKLTARATLLHGIAASIPTQTQTVPRSRLKNNV